MAKTNCAGGGAGRRMTRWRNGYVQTTLLSLNRSPTRTIDRGPATVTILPADEQGVPVRGSVESVQEAELTAPRGRLEELWEAETLERLARAYWSYVSRIFLRLIRVVYAADSTTVVLVSRRLPLLRFGAPAYQTREDGSGGAVCWPIDRGLLVAPEGRGRGKLRISVRQLPRPAAQPECERLHVRVAVRSFYPWIRGRGRFRRAGAWIYGRTQLAIHVVVCRGFLRSLSRLELPEPPVAPDAGGSA